MAASTGPNLSLSYGWTPRSGGTPGDSGWGDPVSANFKKLDALVGLSVLSAAVTAPVVTTDGTRYIVPPTGATGAFAGKENQVAVRVAGAWEFYVPGRGWLAENQATGAVLKWDGAAWVDVLAAISPGNNLLPDAYSWGAATLPVTPATSGYTVIAQAVSAALSAWGFKTTTTSTATSSFYMLSPANTATGWNIALEPGDYVLSFYASSPSAGHRIQVGFWDGVAKLSPDITLTTTRTRYSAVITITAATIASMYFLINRSGVSGVDVTIDSPMCSKRASPGSGTTPPPFAPGNSAARVAALTRATSLQVNNPGAATLVNGAGFTKIALGTVVEDTRNGWSVPNNTYTPAESGMYLVQAMLRPVRVGTDNMPIDTNLKLGFGSAAADGIDVECDTSSDTLPFTISFCKPMRLVAGTPYFIFGNHTAAAPIAFTYGELKITKIGS
jgi:hypothetical protein